MSFIVMVLSLMGFDAIRAHRPNSFNAVYRGMLVAIVGNCFGISDSRYFGKDGA